MDEHDTLTSNGSPLSFIDKRLAKAEARTPRLKRALEGCCYDTHTAEDTCPVFDAARGIECCYDSHDRNDECDNA